MKRWTLLFAAFLAVGSAQTQAVAQAAEGDARASFIFDGARIEITQDAAAAAVHAARFAATPPACDPGCIAPATAAQGVPTVIEPDVLAFLVERVGKNEGLLVDARMPPERALGFIPGSVSLPFAAAAPDNEFRKDILKALGAREFEGIFNFSDALDLVVYDVGPVRSDAMTLIGHLLEAGYPADKLNYYRGGMQVWSALGLTIKE
ncbi:rhodanese-like domain-containing protein [Sulfitobacter albidus]|uniref:Rhodanese-like domain-containing protein n=1 Tax=Sulfitobacter albidus TaxID=2829501 RepID=A0A975JDJ8_9RHOB|nr:rhodanese-like domain-containing protein [Sulfitobacter albidus]QUJ76522.1 rhodanese-like domain-containing protein [Sulfitobacter albidus]